ncbi:MAG: hypothetical protein WAU82_21380 [Candidatus Binatus sp.]|uniref:hypothetical protein n=1 Tax=Candidatus Binatus sp. TaxID=2811406 RepID=UPI003BD23B91
MMVASAVIQAACAALLVIITYLLVRVGRTQAEWMGKQAEWMGKTNAIYEAQRELLRQEILLTHRPLIRVRDITFAKEPVPNGPIEVCLEFSNIGASTATIISSNVTIQLGPVDSVPWRMFSRIPQPFDEELDTLENGYESTIKTIRALPWKLG